MGKDMMTHTWDNFRKDGFLLSTSKERCVDFPALEHFMLFSVWFWDTTNLRISHRSYKMHPKFLLNTLWAEITTNQVSFEEERPTLHIHFYSFFLQASQQLDCLIDQTMNAFKGFTKRCSTQIPYGWQAIGGKRQQQKSPKWLSRAREYGVDYIIVCMPTLAFMQHPYRQKHI